MKTHIRACLIVTWVTASLAPAEMVTRRWGTPRAGGATRAPQAPLPTGYAPKAAPAPALDGKLDDACWAKAPALLLSRTLDGAGRAAEPAEVRLVRDDKTLYVAVRCTEPAMAKVRASRRSHDGQVWGDDSVEMFLGVGGTYYHFGVNAAGSTYDGKVKDGSWNSGLKAAATRGPKEWAAELAIPLTPMVGDAEVPVEWTANFNRNRHVTGSMQESAWSPTLSGDSHVPARFGKLLLADPPTAPAGPRPVVRKGSVTILPAAGGECVVRFDLSDLPEGTKVYRADLLVSRTARVTGADDEALKDIEIYPLFAELGAGGKPVALRGPWFDRFDVTEAVRQWVAGKANGGFFIKVCPFLDKASTCLDVAYEGKLDKLPTQVTGVHADHNAGQTFITWKEIDDLVGADEVQWGRLRGILAGLDRKRRVRYCVYRSAERITAANVHQAELIARIAPLSGWNINGRNVDLPIDHALGHQYVLNWHQWNPFRSANVNGPFGLQCAMERLVIRDGAKPLPRGTGLYVHTAGKAGKAHYAVVTSIDGVQNTAELSEANSVATAVAEVAGAGKPVLQKVFEPKPYFNYKEKRLHYVRWVAPPYCNLPSEYHNWSVGVPDKHGKTMPVELSLHRDGRSHARTQFRIEKDSLVLSPHDFPVKTWWYGYHESLGTLRSFGQGVVHNYTERRLLAFLDWATRKWPVDQGRVLVVGCGGGAAGGGALHLGIRHPQVFNMILSGYGAGDYAGELAHLARIKRAGTIPREMQSIWGKVDWGLKTSAGGRVWEELNLTRTVRSLPDEVCLPLVTLTGRGMSQPVRDFLAALLEKRQPVMYRFGVYGGGLLLPISRTGTWTRTIRQDLSLNQALPVFLGSGTAGLYARPKEPSGNLVVSDGIKWWWGTAGTGYRWKTDDIVDKRSRFEITLFWAGSRRVRKPHADVTIRRVQNFTPRPNYEYTYEIRSAKGGKLQEGKVIPGRKGRMSFNGVPIPPEGTRLIVRP